jgi:hypothetical protein
MRYLLLIAGDTQVLEQLPPEAQSTLAQAWSHYAAELHAAGALLSAAALQGLATATTVRATNGQPLITDGPFAETKEQLTGYFLIDAPDLDAAIIWAGHMPHLAYGGAAEVRPLRPDDPPAR